MFLQLNDHQYKVVSEVFTEFPENNFKISQNDDGDVILHCFTKGNLFTVIIHKEEDSTISIINDDKNCKSSDRRKRMV